VDDIVLNSSRSANSAKEGINNEELKRFLEISTTRISASTRCNRGSSFPLVVKCPLAVVHTVREGSNLKSQLPSWNRGVAHQLMGAGVVANPIISLA
jgi:hypothetical protein